MKVTTNSGGVSPELQAIIDHTKDLMFVKNLDFVYVAASESYTLDCVKCGGVDAVLGKTDYELFGDREIAEGYRRDDLNLLASGESMTEFEEEYPDRDGVKHRCLVTKVLLHNDAGEPIGIFGQYHDIGDAAEKEIVRRREIHRNVAAALSESFFATNYINLRTNAFYTLRALDYARDMLAECRTAEEALAAFIEALVQPEYREKVRAFCDLETMADRVKGRAQIDCEYLSKVTHGWCRMSFRPTEWDEAGEVTHVLLAICNIDEEMAQEIEESIENKQSLAKNAASMMTLLAASNQIGYEYDPVGHSCTCLVREETFGWPEVVERFPDSLVESEMIFPGDADLFEQAVREIDDGAKQAQCDVRMRKAETYCWYSCTFDRWHDEGANRDLVILSIMDISFRVEALKRYRDRLHALERANEDALCMCDVNLTRNRFSNVQAESISKERADIKECAERATTMDEFLQLTSQAVFDEKERNAYLECFDRRHMLERYEQGWKKVKFEHFYRISENHTEWVETVFELIQEPITRDIVGICYMRSLNERRMSRILLDAALDRDYPMASLVYADTGEFYLYVKAYGQYCEHRQDFWNAIRRHGEDGVKPEQQDRIREILTKEHILEELKEKAEYADAFYTFFHGKRCRLEVMFRYADRKHGLLLVTLRNITDEALYEQYRYEGEHDELTGLLNRKTLFKECRRLLTENPGEQFVMVHYDIRQFHLYNTFYGDEAGDDLLKRIAELLEEIGEGQGYTEERVCGRLESDVFCTFFPLQKKEFEERARHFFREIITYSDVFPLEPMVGVYFVTDPSMSVEAMFARATMAAKSGKNNLFGLASRYDEAMENALQDSQKIIGEMNRALSEEQFEVYLQPKYSLRSEELVGAEALVRWKHPTWGMVSPERFIPVFEQNGFIINLDQYMWEHVCRYLREWQDAGKKLFPVSVNISRVSMYSRATVPFLIGLVEKYGIDPKYLELELTETAYMDDPEDLTRMLRELREYGFTILMDDFGSGYSSLNTLRNLPVDVLKVDMKFIRESQDDPRGQAILSSIIRMSKVLGLPVVAEGVETKEQADYLCSIGCEYVQGYLFAKPMPVADYEALVESSFESGAMATGAATGATAEAEAAEEKAMVETLLADVPEIREDSPFVSMGILEYADDRFAYLRTNRRFLREFNLIWDLEPASKVFREHLDEENYAALLRGFGYCAETQKNAVVRIHWLAEDGERRDYFGRIHYNGRIGNYADLSVVFLNVTGLEVFGE